jgi:hypothetical protein
MGKASVKCMSMRVFLFLFLLITAIQLQAAPASRPFAMAMADLVHDMTDALNYLQSELGRPPVAEVRYDGSTNRFYWQGPRTGKAMSMDAQRFLKEIYYPYLIHTGEYTTD